MIEDITLKGCLEFAVATEDLGIRFYARLASKFSDNEDIARIFQQLGDDERVHKREFKELLRESPEEGGVSDSPEKRAYLRAMSISEFFSHRHGPFQDVGGIQNQDDALQKALDFEKATLGFYKAVEDVLGTHERLRQVIQVEKDHVAVLMKALLVEGSKFRGLQDRWP